MSAAGHTQPSKTSYDVEEVSPKQEHSVVVTVLFKLTPLGEAIMGITESRMSSIKLRLSYTGELGLLLFSL